MTELEAILQKYAVDDDIDVEHAWDIKINSAVTYVTAATVREFENPNQAFEAALELQRALVIEGLELRHRCTIGVTTDNPGERWRGTVNVGLGKARQ
jgi:hypothetical protein